MSATPQWPQRSYHVIRKKTRQPSLRENTKKSPSMANAFHDTTKAASARGVHLQGEESLATGSNFLAFAVDVFASSVSALSFFLFSTSVCVGVKELEGCLTAAAAAVAPFLRVRWPFFLWFFVSFVSSFVLYEFISSIDTHVSFLSTRMPPSTFRDEFSRLKERGQTKPSAGGDSVCPTFSVFF